MNTGFGKSKDDKHPFSVKERLKSIGDAANGIWKLMRYEHNFRIQLLVLLAVILSGILLGISGYDWIAITLAAGLVLACESINSALEYLSDKVSPKEDPMIKRVKDAAAAGVLISAITAVIVGVIIFLPRIVKVLYE